MPANAFIANSKSRTLKKRLEELIHYSRELKFLVGFFYFSGWRELYDSLKNRRDLIIKLLVGLDALSSLILAPHCVRCSAGEQSPSRPGDCFPCGDDIVGHRTPFSQ